MTSIQYKIVNQAIIDNNWHPERQHQSAGLDLRAVWSSTTTVSHTCGQIDEQSLRIEPGAAVLIPTGLAVWIQDPTMVGLIFPRSGLGHKQGLILGNGVGVIDSDYQGELMVSLWNRSSDPRVVLFGDRIAQLVVTPIVLPELHLVDEWSYDTDRGAGGFGSTGIK